LIVRHETGNYAVIVRPGALADLQALLEERHPGARPVVIADATVAAARANPLPGVPCLTFPAGERNKVRKTWAMLTDQMLAEGLDRETVVIGFGGGVTTDLAGFVAATYLRGVPWIAVPTSTLAMVDA
jgi:3-dehydroquinate synthetase